KTTHDEDAVRYAEYAVEAGGTVFGIRQDLIPFDEVRLGMPVSVRVDGANAVIDWRSSGAVNWKMVKKPPAAGIVDDFDINDNRGALTKAQRGGRAATVTILDWQARSVALGLATALDARVRIEPAGGAPREETVAKLDRVPGYAAHLPIVGAALPAWETRGLLGGEGIMIDWPAAAMASPGVGEPPFELPRGHNLFGGASGSMSMGGADADSPAGTAEGDPEIPEYAKKLMKKFGVDPDSLKPQ
ncbi:MAG: hypothetical protein ABIQ01_00105, partial [Pseudolysinimonas sp.]